MIGTIAGFKMSTVKLRSSFPDIVMNSNVQRFQYISFLVAFLIFLNTPILKTDTGFYQINPLWFPNNIFRTRRNYTAAPM